LDIKPDTKVELKSGTKAKVMGQLQDGRYMVLGSRKGDILYCKEKDIASVKDK
jgi:hypothetical protein